MRSRIALAAVAALVAVIAFGGRGGAEPLVDAPHGRLGMAFFADGMDTTIYTPSAAVGAALPWEVDAEVHWVADVITSASVDVVSAATAYMEETRQEVGVSAAREAAGSGLALNAAYLFTFENDSYSHVAQAGLRRSLWRKNLDVALSYGVSYNRTGLLGESWDQWKASLIHSSEAGATVVIDPRTVGEVVWSFFYVDGYQANPYRMVPILESMDLLGASSVPEAVPDSRVRNAITGRVRHAFGRRWIGSAEYRFYFDDWGVVAHTEVVEASLSLGRGLSLRLRERVSIQGAAWFYEAEYTREPRYRTRDRRLSDHQSGMGGAAIMWDVGRIEPIGEINVRAGVDGLFWRYPDYVGPELTITGGTELEPVGWVWGTLVQVGIEVTP